ncbi:MAG TPA: glycosyltransferase family 2 protein [Terriglobia bacterium]|nr:glycosyltransferase family 2 protein [Terriglobia bacterium]
MDLTVIIPTHNRNDGVVECFLAVDFLEADIVVVDDGSEEPVFLPSKTARVIRHDRHRGRAAAINTGLRAALCDTVLVIDDDIYAAPDMVVRLLDEFAIHHNPKLGLAPRVVWDPDLPPTLTMKWMEDANKFQPPMLLWKPFVLACGGYDENFTRRLEDLELQLRLQQQGFELHTVESAVGFQHNMIRIRDLIEREFMEGLSAVFVHSKFPDFMRHIDDVDALVRNENQTADAEAAVEEIALLEQSGSSILPSGAAELYTHVCRHYFLHGVFEGLKDIGGMRSRRPNSTTVAIYNQASHLEKVGEFDEARRLFQLVRQRPDEEYWDGAEYHLGCIETGLGNPSAAHFHFTECLRRNPGHNKARRILNQSTLYREVAPNVFEIIEPAAPRVLFIVFGGLSNIVNSFPVVAALREKFHCESVWLTSPEYVSLAQASFADAVRETEPRGILPWNWIHSEGFSHVFFAEPEANQEEWLQTGLHPIDFMARKCGVEIETHRAWLEPGADALFEAEEFLRQHGLSRGGFVTACQGNNRGRHWPSSNLTRLAHQLDMPMVVFGRKAAPEIPGAIPCLDKPFQVIAAIIRWSCFFLGPDSGISWLATTTNTPMAVIVDLLRQNPSNMSFRAALRGERDDIQEWDIYTSLQTVLAHIESKLPLEVAGRS